MDTTPSTFTAPLLREHTPVVRTSDSVRGTVVDTGCDYVVAHVAFDDGTTGTFEWELDEGYVDPDTDVTVLSVRELTAPDDDTRFWLHRTGVRA